MKQNQKDSGVRGGARPGAGRKKGSPNSKTRMIAEKAMEQGITPLEYMLQVMRTEPDPELEPREYLAAVNMRLDAAKSAAPYVHPRLAAVEVTGKDGKDLVPEPKGVLVVPGIMTDPGAWAAAVEKAKPKG